MLSGQTNPEWAYAIRLNARNTDTPVSSLGDKRNTIIADVIGIIVLAVGDAADVNERRGHGKLRFACFSSRISRSSSAQTKCDQHYDPTRENSQIAHGLALLAGTPIINSANKYIG
jgi:hypothetical protein